MTQKYTSRTRMLYANDDEKRNGHYRVQRKYRSNKRAKVLEHLGGVCVQCGFSDERALQVDHIKGGGSQARRKYTCAQTIYNQVLDDDGTHFQLLCANCNWIKRYENKEIMGYVEL